MNARPESNFTERRQAQVQGTLASGGEPPHDDAMRERIATLEATIGTIRAEMRANLAEIQSSNAETRSALLTAFERLRSDTTIQMHSFKVSALAGVVSFLVALLIAAIGWLLRH